MSDLKPCPFCGGEANLISTEPSDANFNRGAVHFGVACGEIGCGVIPKSNLFQCNEEDAVEAWNTRAVECPEASDRVNEIEDMIAQQKLSAAQVFTQMRQLIPKS